VVRLLSRERVACDLQQNIRQTNFWSEILIMVILDWNTCQTSNISSSKFVTCHSEKKMFVARCSIY